MDSYLIYDGRTSPVSSYGWAMEPEATVELEDIDGPGCIYWQGLGPDSTASELNEARMAASYLVEGWNHKKLVTIQGALNKLLYHYADGLGCITTHKVPGYTSEDKGIRQVLAGKLREAVQCHHVLICAMSAIRDHVWQWFGQTIARGTLRGYMDELAELGFLEYKSEQGKGKLSRQWILYPGALLVLCEAIEGALVTRYGMPSGEHECEYDNDFDAAYGDGWGHKAHTLRQLFNALFPGWGWGRKGDPDMNEPETVEEADLYAEHLVTDKVSQWWHRVGGDCVKEKTIELLKKFWELGYWDIWGRLLSKFGSTYQVMTIDLGDDIGTFRTGWMKTC